MVTDRDRVRVPMAQPTDSVFSHENTAAPALRSKLELKVVVPVADVTRPPVATVNPLKRDDVGVEMTSLPPQPRPSAVSSPLVAESKGLLQPDTPKNRRTSSVRRWFNTISQSFRRPKAAASDLPPGHALLTSRTVSYRYLTYVDCCSALALSLTHTSRACCADVSVMCCFSVFLRPCRGYRCAKGFKSCTRSKGTSCLQRWRCFCCFSGCCSSSPWRLVRVLTFPALWLISHRCVR